MKKITLFVLMLILYNIHLNSRDIPSLFPEVEGFKLIKNETVYYPDNLWDIINGAADAYLSYDFQDLHLAEYKKTDDLIVNVEIYRHSTITNAYGIYCSERSSDYNFINIGSQGYIESGVLNFLSGIYYVKIKCYSDAENIQTIILKIGKAIDYNLKQDKAFPAVLSLFPQKGKKQYSDIYIANSFFGHSFLHSAFLANYNIDDITFKMFIIKLETPEEAKEMLKKYLEFTKQNDLEIAEGNFLVKDPYNGNINVNLKKNYLFGIFDSEDPNIINEFLQLVENNILKAE